MYIIEAQYSFPFILSIRLFLDMNFLYCWSDYMELQPCELILNVCIFLLYVLFWLAVWLICI